MKFRFSILLLVLLLAGCSSDLVHTWNIDKLETHREDDKNTSYVNIGTLTFNKNLTGNTDFTIIEENYSDKVPVKWEMKDGYLLIRDANANEHSRLSKAWIIIEDSSKKQIWKSTDGSFTVHTLQLSRN